MSSSFDVVTDEEVQEWLEPTPARSVYETVTSLYAHYRHSDTNLRLRHATRIRCGEVEDDPLDFVLDVEIKARRALGFSRAYALWDRLGKDEESAKLVPSKAQDELSMAWKNLIPAYSKLFKNAQHNYDVQQIKEQRRQAKVRAEAITILTTQKTQRPTQFRTEGIL